MLDSDQRGVHRARLALPALFRFVPAFLGGVACHSRNWGQQIDAVDNVQLMYNSMLYGAMCGHERLTQDG